MKEEKILQEQGDAAAAAVPAVNKRALAREVGMKVVFIIAAAVFIAVVAVICVYLFVEAVPTIAEVGFFEFVFGGTWSPSTGAYGGGAFYRRAHRPARSRIYGVLLSQVAV